MLARIRKQLEEKDDKGFTLVELLVVIIIIGILAAIAIPLYLNQQNKAKDSSAKADLNTVRTAVVSAITENPTANTVTCNTGTGTQAVSTSSLDGSTSSYSFTISPGNELTVCTATLSPEAVTITIKSATGNTYSIDATGKITEVTV